MTTDTPYDHDVERCKPLQLDFAKMTDNIQARADAMGRPLRGSKVIAHTLAHLREELPDLTDRQIARVALTLGALASDMIRNSDKWNATGIANIIISSGAALWAGDPDRTLTPEQWSTQYGIVVRDPDGWREDGQSWETPITLREFNRRMTCSTTGPDMAEIRGRLSDDVAALPKQPKADTDTDTESDPT